MDNSELTEQSQSTEIQHFDAGSQSLAVALSRAEIDQQVATARALPRSIDRIVKNILSLATLDEDSAAECIYALPRGNKPIKGPSIRMAEIIYSQWGNCRVGSRVVHVDRAEKFVEAEGVFHDLETNAASTARVRRRISDKNGKILSDDMIIVTGNAASAIAKRNAILGGVPKAVWRKAYEAVENVITGNVQTLVVRREHAMKAFAAFGVKPEQIYEALGVSGLDDVSLSHIAVLVGMHSALKNGEETVETMFSKDKALKPASANPLLPPKEEPLAPLLERLADALKLATDKDGVDAVLSIYDDEISEQDDGTKETVRLAVNAKQMELDKAA